MNTRAALHSVAGGLALVAGGTVVLSGLPPHLTMIIVAVSTVSAAMINQYLVATSSGVNAAAGSSADALTTAQIVEAINKTLSTK